MARSASARCDERLVDSRCVQDVGASYLHRHEDGTLVASKASSRQAIQDYKKKERERQQLQKQPGKPGTQPKPGMAEGWQLKSLKELTESDAPTPSLLPPPPHQPAALSQELPAPQVSAAKDASAASSQSQRNVPAASASKRPAQNLSQAKLHSTDAPAQSELSTKAGSSAAPAPTAADATAGTHGPPSPSSLPSAHMLQGVSVTPTVSTAQAKAAPAASVRLNATGKHASEVSGVYQKTGERVNGYPLYKKVGGP